MEGFCDITVCTVQEPCHLVGFIGFSGQHENRGHVIGSSHLLKHFITSHIFHHHIKDYETEFLLFQKLQGDASVVSFCHMHPLPLQCSTYRHTYRNLVIYHKFLKKPATSISEVMVLPSALSFFNEVTIFTTERMIIMPRMICGQNAAPSSVGDAAAAGSAPIIAKSPIPAIIKTAEKMISKISPPF